uniref:Uncharacterized protein n=1 Tax=Panagrolaimus davidi TaxID=227884 RepID=A0A914Q0R0_9BILA
MLENKQIEFMLCFNHDIMPEEYMLKVKTFVKKLATEDYGDYQRPLLLIYREGVINAIEDDNGDEEDDDGNNDD